MSNISSQERGAAITIQNVNGLALLWQRILQTDPQTLFGMGADRLQNRGWGDRIAQPGYVGREYEPGGLVFVSMNPGGGREKDEANAEDRRQYAVLTRLRDADANSVVPIFYKLSAVLSDIMPTWKIHRNFVVPVLKSAGVSFQRVAYLNLLKWRTESSSGLNQLYDISWQDHVREQIELLTPSTVIAIGSDAGNAFRRHHQKTIHFDAIPRVIGNNVGTPGREALARIDGWLRDHPMTTGRDRHPNGTNVDK